jgi:hypothetical protein
MPKTAPKLPKIPPLELDGFSLDVNYYVTKEYNDIQEAAVELPAIIEWLNWQNQIAIESKIRTKSQIDRSEAQAYFDLKNGGFQRKGYGDKATEDALKRAVALDEASAQLAEDFAVYSALVDRLTNVQRSLQFKLELVRSTEATKRMVAS